MKKRLAAVLIACGIMLNAMIPAAAQESETRNTETTGTIEIQTPKAVVMEVSTGKVLFDKNKDEKAHPASVTKIMTLLLIFEALDRGEFHLDTEVTTSAHAKSMGGSQVFLEEGEIQDVETLIKCIVIASGNDAAVAMAEKVSGTEETFVAEMNQRASELGMNNTNFVDCCGLTDDSAHYTTAYDIALMSRELLNNHPQVTEYAKIWMEDITHVTGKGASPFTLTNTNKLLRAYHGCDGLKTGSTSLAKYCLSATANREGLRMISVILGAPDSKTRFAEAGKLMDYGFSICSVYRDEEPLILPEIQIKGMISETVAVDYETDFSYLSTKKEDFSAVEKKLTWEKELRAPMKKGEKAGECIYFLDGREIGRCAVVLTEDAPKAAYPEWLNYMWECWII